MDTGLQRTALLRFHPVTLALEFAIDTTDYAIYMDSIDFDDEGRVWFNDIEDNQLLGFASVVWSSFIIDSGGTPILNPDSSAWGKCRYLYNRARWGAPQGIRIRNGYIYIVPENEPADVPPNTAPADNGIILFKIDELLDAGSSTTDPINTPKFHYPFQLPSPGHADHEGFAFDATDPNFIWISTAADGGAMLYKLELEPVP